MIKPKISLGGFILIFDFSSFLTEKRLGQTQSPSVALTLHLQRKNAEKAKKETLSQFLDKPLASCVRIL